jgi:DNA adenine methylase
MNSFIPWVGGKSRLRKQILEMFPTDKPKLYIEVFGGAGWVLFARDNHAQTEVFNDKDGHLINLYRCIQHHCEELKREILCFNSEPALNSRELFEDYLAQLKTRGLTDIQRAARYFYLIKISYGAGRECFCCNKKTLDGAVGKLPEIQKRLKNVVIENCDFERILKTYDRDGALFYLDPPYFKAENFYQGFEHCDHERLLESVKKIKGKFILSYNDEPEIRALYKGYNITEVERLNNLAVRYADRNKTYNELIITNF